MSTTYRRRSFVVNDNLLGMVLQNSQGSANLVGLCNMLILHGLPVLGVDEVTEETLISNVRLMLQNSMSEIEGIKAEDVSAVNHVLDAFRTDFALHPCLIGHKEFMNNASSKLCSFLGVSFCHGWVLNPEISSYDTLKGLTRPELEKYCREMQGQDSQDLADCEDLLNINQLTSYGLDSLPAEVTKGGVELFYWRNRLDILHKHESVLFLYVTDEDIYEQMPTACWMLLEESQESNIYFTEKYSTVKGQPFEERAKEWHTSWCAEIAARKQLAKEKKKKRNKGKKASQHGQADVGAPGNKGVERNKNAERNKRKKLKKRGKKLMSNEGQSVDMAPEDSKPSEAVGSEGEDSSDELTSYDDKGAEAVGSHRSEGQDDAGNLSDDDKAAEALRAHYSERQGSTVSSSEGDPSDFLMFLKNFKDDGCTEHYFKGTVAAFTSQSPFFYVPYQFIMAYDEPLALKIQDHYSRIYEDLSKDVVYYLSKNKVYFPNAQLRIIGLPEPKSTQLYLDYIGSIILHEHYDIYGEDSEALPSSDSRRMGLGYLACIVSKFREGRCWNGEWSEENMKVKNKGKDFVIDCQNDYELTPDRGYRDLNKFTTTVLERLRFNGNLPPYCDQFGEDIMFINDCFQHPVKWERFLQLISYPLGLKPPLVRAALICNVYVVANANTSGDPARYSPFFTRKDCFDWRGIALQHQLLRKVYEHQSVYKVKKAKYLMDIWSVSHWHVFKFSRHFIQHVLRHTKGKDLIQKAKDISVVDILLSRTIWKAIAQSVRFLVINCGIHGLFSSAWRHYAGSDYVDKPNEILEETTGDLEDLVDSISGKKSGYVITEVEIFSEPEHVSILISNADLIQLKSELERNGFECECVNADTLQCGSIFLSSRCYPAERNAPERTVIMVNGPFSEEYDSVFFFLTRWLCL